MKRSSFKVIVPFILTGAFYYTFKSDRLSEKNTQDLPGIHRPQDSEGTFVSGDQGDNRDMLHLVQDGRGRTIRPRGKKLGEKTQTLPAAPKKKPVSKKPKVVKRSNVVSSMRDNNTVDTLFASYETEAFSPFAFSPAQSPISLPQVVTKKYRAKVKQIQEATVLAPVAAIGGAPVPIGGNPIQDIDYNTDDLFGGEDIQLGFHAYQPISEAKQKQKNEYRRLFNLPINALDLEIADLEKIYVALNKVQQKYWNYLNKGEHLPVSTSPTVQNYRNIINQQADSIKQSQLPGVLLDRLGGKDHAKIQKHLGDIGKICKNAENLRKNAFAQPTATLYVDLSDEEKGKRLQEYVFGAELLGDNISLENVWIVVQALVKGPVKKPDPQFIPEDAFNKMRNYAPLVVLLGLSDKTDGVEQYKKNIATMQALSQESPQDFEHNLDPNALIEHMKSLFYIVKSLEHLDDIIKAYQALPAEEKQGEQDMTQVIQALEQEKNQGIITQGQNAIAQTLPGILTHIKGMMGQALGQAKASIGALKQNAQNLAQLCTTQNVIEKSSRVCDKAGQILQAVIQIAQDTGHDALATQSKTAWDAQQNDPNYTEMHITLKNIPTDVEHGMAAFKQTPYTDLPVEQKALRVLLAGAENNNVEFFTKAVQASLGVATQEQRTKITRGKKSGKKSGITYVSRDIKDVFQDIVNEMKSQADDEGIFHIFSTLSQLEQTLNAVVLGNKIIDAKHIPDATCQAMHKFILATVLPGILQDVDKLCDEKIVNYKNYIDTLSTVQIFDSLRELIDKDNTLYDCVKDSACNPGDVKKIFDKKSAFEAEYKEKVEALNAWMGQAFENKSLENSFPIDLATQYHVDDQGASLMQYLKNVGADLAKKKKHIEICQQSLQNASVEQKNVMKNVLNLNEQEEGQKLAGHLKTIDALISIQTKLLGLEQDQDFQALLVPHPDQADDIKVQNIGQTIAQATSEQESLALDQRVQDFITTCDKKIQLIEGFDQDIQDLDLFQTEKKKWTDAKQEFIQHQKDITSNIQNIRTKALQQKDVDADNFIKTLSIAGEQALDVQVQGSTDQYTDVTSKQNPTLQDWEACKNQLQALLLKMRDMQQAIAHITDANIKNHAKVQQYLAYINKSEQVVQPLAQDITVKYNAAHAVEGELQAFIGTDPQKNMRKIFESQADVVQHVMAEKIKELGKIFDIQGAQNSGQAKMCEDGYKKEIQNLDNILHNLQALSAEASKDPRFIRWEKRVNTVKTILKQSKNVANQKCTHLKAKEDAFAKNQIQDINQAVQDITVDEAQITQNLQALDLIINNTKFIDGKKDDDTVKLNEAKADIEKKLMDYQSFDGNIQNNDQVQDAKKKLDTQYALIQEALNTYTKKTNVLGAIFQKTEELHVSYGDNLKQFETTRQALVHQFQNNPTTDEERIQDLQAFASFKASVTEIKDVLKTIEEGCADPNNQALNLTKDEGVAYWIQCLKQAIDMPKVGEVYYTYSNRVYTQHAQDSDAYKKSITDAQQRIKTLKEKRQEFEQKGGEDIDDNKDEFYSKAFYAQMTHPLWHMINVLEVKDSVLEYANVNLKVAPEKIQQIQAYNNNMAAESDPSKESIDTVTHLIIPNDQAIKGLEKDIFLFIGLGLSTQKDYVEQHMVPGMLTAVDNIQHVINLWDSIPQQKKVEKTKNDLEALLQKCKIWYSDLEKNRDVMKKYPQMYMQDIRDTLSKNTTISLTVTDNKPDQNDKENIVLETVAGYYVVVQNSQVKQTLEFWNERALDDCKAQYNTLAQDIDQQKNLIQTLSQDEKNLPIIKLVQKEVEALEQSIQDVQSYVDEKTKEFYITKQAVQQDLNSFAQLENNKTIQNIATQYEQDNTTLAGWKVEQVPGNTLDTEHAQITAEIQNMNQKRKLIDALMTTIANDSKNNPIKRIDYIKHDDADMPQHIEKIQTSLHKIIHTRSVHVQAVQNRIHQQKLIDQTAEQKKQSQASDYNYKVSDFSDLIQQYPHIKNLGQQQAWNDYGFSYTARKALYDNDYRKHFSGKLVDNISFSLPQNKKKPDIYNTLIQHHSKTAAQFFDILKDACGSITEEILQEYTKAIKNRKQEVKDKFKNMEFIGSKSIEGDRKYINAYDDILRIGSRGDNTCGPNSLCVDLFQMGVDILPRMFFVKNTVKPFSDLSYKNIQILKEVITKCSRLSNYQNVMGATYEYTTEEILGWKPGIEKSEITTYLVNRVKNIVPYYREIVKESSGLDTKKWLDDLVTGSDITDKEAELFYTAEKSYKILKEYFAMLTPALGKGDPMMANIDGYGDDIDGYVTNIAALTSGLNYMCFVAENNVATHQVRVLGEFVSECNEEGLAIVFLRNGSHFDQLLIRGFPMSEKLMARMYENLYIGSFPMNAMKSFQLVSERLYNSNVPLFQKIVEKFPMNTVKNGQYQGTDFDPTRYCISHQNLEPISQVLPKN